MKIIQILLIGIGLLILLFGCDPKESELKPKYPCTELIGEHELRKFKVIDRYTKETKWSFFLIGGSGSSIESTDSEIAFYWKNNSGEYVYSSVNFNRMRIKLDSSYTEPYVTFTPNYSNYYNCGSTLNYTINSSHYTEYITIHCRPEDFPEEIYINQL